MMRAVIVIGVSALVIGLTVPNMFVGRDFYALPFSVDYHYDVISITADSIATQAGLQVGDHIEPRTTNILARMAMQTWYLYPPGGSMSFVVDRGGRSIPITLRFPAMTPSSAGVVAIVKRSTATIFIVVAAILLMLRPSPMTWGFWLYAVGSTNGGSVIMERVSDAGVVVANTALVTIAYDILAPLGLLIFATRFPTSSASGVRRLVERLIPILALLLALPSISYVLFLSGVAQPSQTLAIMNLVTEGTALVGLATLIAGLVQAEPVQRQRLRWVVSGFAIFYAVFAYQELSLYLPGQGWPAQWTNAGVTSDILDGLVVFIPITVAYAVLKHHVLDLNFVIGRGIVYGILTSIAVAAFALIEWILGGVLAQTKLAATGEVIAAIAIGLWLNSLHRQVDRFVDATIFRRRHLAERRLAEVAAGLPHAQAYETVASMLVGEPVDALGFSSAALYRRSDAGVFRLECSVGVKAPSEIAVVAGDALAVRLHGARGPISVQHVRPDNRSGAPEDDFVVALPVFVRHELAAIAFYGPHATGEAIDPDEMRALQALCMGASAALDHIEASELRRRLDESERTVAALRIATAQT